MQRFQLDDVKVLGVSGPDRAAWLNGLVTNDVAGREPGQGGYAFATNAQGRILCDLTILVDAQEILALVPAERFDAIRAHFEKYLILEDAAISDRPDLTVMAVFGADVPRLMAELGWAEMDDSGPLEHRRIEIGGFPVLAVRDDLSQPGCLLLVARLQADAVRRRLGEAGVVAGRYADLEVMRIEQGRPRFGQDFDETTLPAETGQLDRAVSFTKGCYLGQEVVARMDSHGGLARRLVGLKLASRRVPEPPADLYLGGKLVGRLTSSAASRNAGGVIGLGLVRKDWAAAGTDLQVAGAGPGIKAEVVELPFG